MTNIIVYEALLLHFSSCASSFSFPSFSFNNFRLSFNYSSLNRRRRADNKKSASFRQTKLVLHPIELVDIQHIPSSQPRIYRLRRISPRSQRAARDLSPDLLVGPFPRDWRTSVPRRNLPLRDHENSQPANGRAAPLARPSHSFAFILALNRSREST